MYYDMLRILLLRTILTVFCFSAFSFSSFAQDPLEGYWYNDDKTAKIRIYKASNGKFYGKVAWLKVPNRDGKPKIDARNPDESKRDQPIVGLVILRGFTKTDDNEYDDGTVYDPRNGKTYDCVITRNGSSIDIRGYVGIQLIGRSTVWTRVN